MTGPVLSSDGLDDRRRRALFRSRHRGIREMDLVLGPFADAWLARLSEQELADYEQLLSVRDHDLLDWVTGIAPPPEVHDTAVLRRLRAFHITSDIAS
jgi:antitoxin CptB